MRLSLEQAIVDEDRGETRQARRQYEALLVEGKAAPAVLVEAGARLGVLMQDDGEGTQARWVYERALALGERELGPAHPLVARVLHELGTYLVSHTLARGRAMIERSEEIWRATSAPDELHMALGRAWLHEQTRPDDVLDHFRVAADLALALLPVGKRDQREPLRLHAAALWSRHRRREALEVHLRKLALYERNLEHRFIVDAISDVALGWQQLGEPRRGREVFDRYLGRMRAELPPDHPRLACLLRSWRTFLTDEKEKVEVRLAVAEEELRLREAGGRVVDDDAIALLGGLVNLAFEQGGPKRAVERMATLSSWAETARDRLDPAATELTKLARTLSTGWTKVQRGDEALQAFRDLIAHREARLGNDHLAVAAAIQAMHGEHGWEQAEQLEPLLRRALAIRERALGPTDDETVDLLAALNGVYSKLEEIELQRNVAQRRLAVWEQVLSPERPDTDRAGLYELASLEHGRAEYPAAYAMWERAIAHAEARLGPVHETVAWLLCRLAQQISWEYQGPRAAEVAPLYERAIEIRRTVEGEYGKGVAEVLSMLADHLTHQPDRIEQVLALRQRIHEIHTRNGDLSSLDWNHRALARLHEGRQEHPLALAELQKALALWEGVPDAFYSAGAVLDELSQFHLRRGQRDEGVAYGDRAVAQYERYDSGGMSGGQALVRVGTALLEGGLAPEAEERFALALPAFEKDSGPGGEETLRVLGLLGDSLAAQDRMDEAAECWARVVAFEKRSDGDDARVKLRLASFHVARRRFAVARRLLEPAIARFKEREWDEKMKPLLAEAEALLLQIQQRQRRKKAK